MRVLLGVTGGIAAYKSAELTRRLKDRGADVQVVMTAGAQHFITPQTFQALSGRPVRTDLWDAAAEAAMGHIELARWPSRIVVAPASADFIARLAHGLAGDLLTTLCLATDVPITVVPAMNRLMWANPATQANVATLRQRGIAILGPAAGEQACGETGPGRMVEPHEIVDALFARAAPCERRAARPQGRRHRGTDARTHRSRPLHHQPQLRQDGFRRRRSGARCGGGRRDRQRPGATCRRRTASGASMSRRRSRCSPRCSAELHDTDIFIGSAAVSDYRAREIAEHKIKKTSDELVLQLSRTPDILATVAAGEPRPSSSGLRPRRRTSRPTRSRSWQARTST